MIPAATSTSSHAKRFSSIKTTTAPTNPPAKALNMDLVNSEIFIPVFLIIRKESVCVRPRIIIRRIMGIVHINIQRINRR